MVGQIHLVDKLLSIGIDIKVIFAPEHGFRDMADAGETIRKWKRSHYRNPFNQSLWELIRNPLADLAGIDVVIFDIQDVGARFYTYISTLHYILEACAENNDKMHCP